MKYLQFFWGWLMWHLKAGVWYTNMSLKIFLGISLDNQRNHGSERDDLADVTYAEPRDYRRWLNG